MHIIYLVQKDNKPVYVGYTSKSIEQRWKQHIYKSIKRPKYPLHHAIKKYGVDSFTIEPIYESEDKYHTLNHMEHHYIWLHQTYFEYKTGGYNLTLVGEGSLKNVTENTKKAQMKDWRKENKEKLKTQHNAWREANKEKLKTQTNAWREANKEKNKNQKKAWYEANKERIKTQQKARREANKKAIPSSYYSIYS